MIIDAALLQDFSISSLSSPEYRGLFSGRILAMPFTSVVQSGTLVQHDDDNVFLTCSNCKVNSVSLATIRLSVSSPKMGSLFYCILCSKLTFFGTATVE
jgi:hypothetical protein